MLDNEHYYNYREELGRHLYIHLVYMFPHLLGNPSDDVVELIEDYITFTLPSEWAQMSPSMQMTIVYLILKKPNKAGAKALVFTKSVFDKLCSIDRVKLASHLKDDECQVMLK